MAISKRSLYHNIALILFNLLLIFIAILTSILYSKNIKESEQKNKLNEFVTNVESMKQVSQNYLDSENGYVLNWANYITSSKLSLSEALDFLKNINTNKERFAHIVDMDNFDAYSATISDNGGVIDTYKRYIGNDLSEYEISFAQKMTTMFKDNTTKFYVLGKYVVPENDQYAISVGKRITLWDNDKSKDYLLLRIIPVNDVKKSWVFPISYKTHGAEVGIITNVGDYVIESDSMKSANFLEYIRIYNFQNDYNKIEQLRLELLNNDSGILYYENYRHHDCIWYYSKLSDDLELDIIGCVNSSILTVDNSNSLFIVSLICGTLLVLVIVDGIYLFYVNKKLKLSAKTANNANMAKTKFLSSMSHDIRTPLNTILGLTYLAKINKDNPSYVEDCLSKSTVAEKQLLTLINDVLDMSKIESGKLYINYAQTKLNTVFDELQDIIEPIALQKKIKIIWDVIIQDNYVETDKLRLQQICLNLLSNAVKYTNCDGKIIFKVREEIVNDNDKITIIVEDNGIGMSEEFQKNMYESFEREITTQVNLTQGTGLGLYIVKHTVEKMNGTIECDSKLNKGTRFKVNLNFKIVDNNETTKINNINYLQLEGMRILIAEDNELNGHILKTMLENNKIKCDLALNGLDCKNMLFSKEPYYYDAILMDVHMPVMDGIEATKIIRSEGTNGRENIPIIALTADVFQENVNECLNAGMTDHITKPVDLEKLLSTLIKIKNEGVINEKENSK